MDLEMKNIVLTSILILALTAACSGPTPPAVTPTATATHPPPTTTSTATSTSTPTPDLTATAQTAATEQVAAYLEELEPILDDLGYSTSRGFLAYYDEGPYSIPLDIPASNLHEQIDSPNTYGNYILGIDLTWETEAGNAGCGLIFGAQGDIRTGESTHFVYTRFSGAPYWGFHHYRGNVFQADLLGSPFGNAAIRQSNGSTNSFVTVLQDSSITWYANDVRLGGGTMPAALLEGSLGYFAWQESGITTCTATNIWIWKLP